MSNTLDSLSDDEVRQIALLVERQGKKLFVFKSKQLPAEGEPQAQFERFLAELDAILSAQSP